ncbi:hypothetical protein MLD38_027226 [Melastoma candidum]|uniref:Uncharacterized protein n=2 Tax=Melastoma candidum TaxID=119954 RepID=A0ACB9P745_9MYRT|nr:hypothetical protein MLD38_027226 [Melastoma candidum]
MISTFCTHPFSFASRGSHRNASGTAPAVAIECRKPGALVCRTLSKMRTSQRTAGPRRKSATYDRNIWHYDFIQSLGQTDPEASAGQKYVAKNRAEQLEKDVLNMLSGPMNSLMRLEMIDCIVKFGLSDLFERQIKAALDELVATSHDDTDNDRRVQPRGSSLYKDALYFRLLRQFGHDVSQGFLLEHVTSDSLGAEALVELLEASSLAREEEDVLDMVRAFSVEALKERVEDLGSDLSERVFHSLELPLHRRVRWFDVRWQIEAYERSKDRNSSLLKLAKHNFNELQAIHQDDLKDVSRWWRDLGLMQHLDFSRDRLVESFVYALGVAPEPEAKPLRRSLTKVVAMILVIDDTYDIFGSLEELRCFTRAIKTWDSNEIEQLPQCMKVSFQALDDVTNQIAKEIGTEANFHRVVPALRKAWANFCEGMFVEAKWDKTGHVPTLEEYLDNAWITSSGPLILSHAYHFLSGDRVEDVPMQLDTNKDLIYHSSVIIRLCNDLRTSTAERERGDAPSSVACYMREADVTEEIAREHIEGLISRSWKGINADLFGDHPEHLRPYMEVTVNAARTAHMVYQHGDGFGVQSGEMRELITASLVQPFRRD